MTEAVNSITFDNIKFNFLIKCKLPLLINLFLTFVKLGLLLSE